MKTKRIVLLLALFIIAMAFTSCHLLPPGVIPGGHEHTWVDATCESPKTCSECGEIEGDALGHAEESVAGYEATCTEAGLTEGTKCSICDAVIVAQEEIAKLAHTPGDAATCTTGQECTVCHNEIASALGHNIVVDEAIEADCLNSGLTEGQHCSRCDDATVEQETVPAFGHEIVEDVAKAPTCTESGLTAGEHCTKCEYTTAQETVPALGHTIVKDAAKAPTCTEPGLTAGEHCTVCDYKVAQETVAALGHTIVKDAAKAPTCTESGLTEGEHCTVCDYKVAQETVAALGHTIVADEAVAPTCTESGLTAGEHCTVCDYVKAQETVAALGHTEENVPGKAATCTETGLTDGKKCSVCGDTIVANEMIPALGHKDDDGNYKCDVCQADLCTEHVASDVVVENRTEASCTAEGSYDNVVKCAHCGEELSRETVVIPMIAHTEELVPGKAATCTETGLTDGKKCSACGTTLVAQEEIPVIAHTEEIVAGKNATCTETGLTEGKKCSVCGTTLVAQEEIPMIAHTEELVPGKAATCEATGLTDGKKCSACGETILAQEEIPAKGHAYDTVYVWADDNSTCTSKQICKNDASHVVSGEAVTVSHVDLHVTASKVTYTYHAGNQTKVVESDLAPENDIATIYAPTVEGRVASHDYVKFSFHEASTHEFIIYYSELSVWDGVSVSESLQGSGTAEDPYLIQSAADLAYIAQVVNALAVKTSAFSGNYIVMTKSIDLNGYELHIGTGTGWGDRQMFAAYLDGNNCTIRGINNSRSLFGCIEGGWVKNLSLYGEVNVVKGANSIGVLVGYNRLAPLSNITNYATMNGNGNVGGLVGNMEQSVDTPATNLVNYGAISGSNNVGGIAGLVGRQLLNCTNWGIISGDHDIGGIVGNLYWACTLTNCTNYGYINGVNNIGGIAGVRNGSIVATLNDCVNYGSVFGTSCISTGVDGITSAESTQNGCVNNGSVAIAEHQLTHTDAKAATCDKDGNVAYDHCSACDKNYDADGKAIANVVISAFGHAWDDGVTADGKITYTCGTCGGTRVEDAKATITVNHLNLDGTVAAEADTISADYGEIITVYAKTIEGYVASHDYVKVHVQGNSSVTIYYSEVSVWDGISVSESLSGTGTATDPYLIQSAADFAYFAGVINAVEGAAGTNYKVTTFKGQYFKMTKSVDLNGHYLIVGMHAGWNNYQGFFGHFDGNNCSIRDINVFSVTGKSSALFGCIASGATLKNLSVYGKVTGASTVGGVVAYQLGTLNNVTSYVTVTATAGTVGGVVANQESSSGDIIGCVNYGSVTSNSYIVGGIVGSGGKTITNSVNWGNVTGGSVSVGGISGSTKDKGTISGCVNYGTITSKTTSTKDTEGAAGGIVGTAKKPISDCANYGTVVGLANKSGEIYGYSYDPSTVTNCVENGEVKN